MNPKLTRATPGGALSAGAWNAVLGGIESFYDALVDAGRSYVEIAVTWRGRAVPDARVIGVALDTAGKPTGPALAAVRPFGDVAVHQLVGVTPGTWEVTAEARGFAPATDQVQVRAVDPPDPSATTELKPARTTVEVPDLVGLHGLLAEQVLKWAQFSKGDWSALLETTDTQRSPILVQGPASGDAFRGTPISALYGPAVDQPPWRVVVPDFLGWPRSAMGDVRNLGNLRLVEGPNAGGGTRVAGQSLKPGTVVAPGTELRPRYTTGEGVTFGAYPSTHAKLATQPVKPVFDTLTAKKAFDEGGLARTSVGAPWDIARNYLSDEKLNAVVDLFTPLGAVVRSSPNEDLAAIWASFLVAVQQNWPETTSV